MNHSGRASFGFDARGTAEFAPVDATAAARLALTAPATAAHRRQLAAVRACDVVVALLALLFLAPLMLLVAIAVVANDAGPIIYAHRRIGRDGRIFPCLKFRTMVCDADRRLAELLLADPDARAEWDRDHKLRNDPRVTIVGRFLRATSLDELPQLWNVLAGDMSLVGPRPIVPAEQARYGRFYHHYCAVTPGITGLWQVSGRNDVSYRRRVACDVLYARTLSVPLYFYILARTFPAVILARGSY